MRLSIDLDLISLEWFNHDPLKLVAQLLQALFLAIHELKGILLRACCGCLARGSRHPLHHKSGIEVPEPELAALHFRLRPKCLLIRLHQLIGDIDVVLGLVEPMADVAHGILPGRGPRHPSESKAPDS